MDKVRLLQYVIYFASTLGILFGLDLIFGAKVMSNLKKVLDRTVLNIDKAVINFFSYINNSVDTSIDIDSKIIKSKARVILGVLFIAICVVMILLARKG